MTTLPLDTLAAGLRANARGVYVTEAAVELLIAHGRWLDRPDFRAACVGTDTHPIDGEWFAWINWDTVPAFAATAPCSTSEERILLLAAELVGVDGPEPLGHLLTGLDDHNARRVADAIGHVLTRGGDRR